MHELGYFWRVSVCVCVLENLCLGADLTCLFFMGENFSLPVKLIFLLFLFDS